MDKKKVTRKDKNKKEKAQEKSRGMVIVPYVHFLTEKIQRIFAKHGVATAVQPHTTLRRVLVHPKDKIYKRKKGGVVYKIPCKHCAEVYVGETGRQFGVRMAEHRKETEKILDRNFTRATSRASASEYHKSAITDHACQNNHITDWKASEIVEQKSDKFKRCIKDSIHIRANTRNMSRDEGAYHLSPIWSQVISNPTQGGGGGGGGSTE